MGPTPTGVIAGCQKFYTVQSGDGCKSIEVEFYITMAQFYAWNPSGISPIPVDDGKYLFLAFLFLTYIQWGTIATNYGWAMRIAYRDLLPPLLQSHRQQ